MEYRKEDLANFGPSVRHLYLNFPDSIHDELIPYLPAMLLTLSLDKNHRITDAGLANLPNWLEALHLPNNYNVTSHCIPKLPRTLKNLSFWTKDAITPGIMSEMPSLTSLRVYGPQCLGGPAIEALPSSLATFAWCYDFYMNSLQIFSLPASVTELYIESIEQTPGAMRRIPSGLKRLTIVSPLSFNIYNFQEHLPKNLLYLDLLGVKTLATGSASCFPPTLVSLSLPSMITITRDEIMAFPKGLHILKMTMLTNFENEWFSVLPPSLHVFYCTWNEQISDDLVNHVPASLYRLVLRARAFPYRDSPETPSDQERLQPIDDYISLARSFPRVVRVHFNAQISHMAVWDLYYFEVDAAKKKLGIHDIVPRSVPSFAFSVIQRKPEPKGWFASLF